MFVYVGRLCEAGSRVFWQVQWSINNPLCVCVYTTKSQVGFINKACEDSVFTMASVNVSRGPLLWGPLSKGPADQDLKVFIGHILIQDVQ